MTTQPRNEPILPERALSIRQPWAWAIINAGKRIENRSRRVNYRGPICIHASSTWKSVEYNSLIYASHDVVANDHWPEGVVIPEWKRQNFPTGGIVATADLVDCVSHQPYAGIRKNQWFFGPYGLVLENVQPVEFIPVKGALGLFKWRDRRDAMEGGAG